MMLKPLQRWFFSQQVVASLAGLVVLGCVFALLLAPTYAEPGAGVNPSAPAAPEDPDAIAFFEEKVRPILDKRCIKCHGGKSTRGDFSMVSREAMLKGGFSGDVIDFQEHAESLFLVAINYTDVDYEMPPSGKLPVEEIETLTKWVAAGLPWTPGEKGLLGDPEAAGGGVPSIEEGKDYWAYKPVVKPDVPEVDELSWAEHPLDAFIYDKLDASGLEPNVPADRVALIRRASYNLTGLPPTPDEVQAFLNDDRPGAWERVIDGYLASPHYGEHWARHWMDLARYAETNGYERDGKKRNIWRYRDYLIRAFNADTPYDRFIKEHVAGDLLPDRDAESYIATGFNRLQIWDDEPTDRVQARADYIGDIVDTTTSAFLATTVACAKCHDHKKDPITQSDYFALYAFFNNIQEQVRGRDDAISLNLRDVPTTEAQRDAIADYDRRVAGLKGAVAEAEQRFVEAAGLDFSKKGGLAPIAPDSRKEHQPWRFALEDPGKDWSVQQFDDRAWPTAEGGFGHRMDRPYFPNDWTSDNIYLRRNFRLTQIPPSLVLSITYQGPSEVYINGIRVYKTNGRRGAGPNHKQFQLPADALRALVVGSNSLAVKSNEGGGPQQFIDAGLYEGIVNERFALRSSIDSSGEAVLGEEAYQAYKGKRSDLEKLINAPVAKPYPAMVLNERGRGLPKQQVHERGSAHALGEEVPPRFPLVMGGEVPDIPKLPKDINANGRRLALADWLASGDNPLTARVMANRIWQHQFGRGIVRTTSDFGRLGERPTHPELLDFLAATFVEMDWSIKDLNKFLMTSKAFQMSSSAQQAGLEKDPNNDLFWRYDMRRLTAEEFRDSLLAVNGSLNPKQFGPSIYTKMPKEVLATASRPGSAWGTSSEAERDRRSVYIHIKRSLREPLLAALDQAETDSPCPVRFATTVPTQSLITLNSEVMQDEAIVFADYLKKEAGPELADQVRLGLELVLTREPTEKEIETNVAFVEKVKREHGLDADRALKLFCLVAYNLNEFVYLD
ncbi:MAG: PSD1 and planctomycete cytochrome C domain-containing protein [Planctomycetota bacterium]